MSTLALFASGVAASGGRAPGPAHFQTGAFCKKYGCVLIATWSRFSRGYEVYRLRRDDKVELAIYRDLGGHSVGATYSTWTVDNWSADYGRAAEFLSEVFIGAPISKNLITSVDNSTTQAGESVNWKGQPLVVFRALDRVPSFNQLLRVSVSAGVFKAGQP